MTENLKKIWLNLLKIVKVRVKPQCRKEIWNSEISIHVIRK